MIKKHYTTTDNIVFMKICNIICVVMATVLSLTSCGESETYYEKNVVFPKDASVEEKMDMASRLVPSEQQLAWQQLETTAFLHFGINTFTGREWGDGSEDPALFNPTELDAGQWVLALKNGGFKMAILTAKHHDGFCLWQTGTTRHSVASSPWKNGKGDVVREVKDACDKYGMKFGIYLSPWDRNAGCYGDSPAYNAFFIKQLTELLTNYGEINEVWFDGACAEGPDGRKQEYAWKDFYATIKKLQPMAVMAIMGDDIRWVGNEKGIGRETEWSATVLAPGIYERAEESNARLGIFQKSPDLGGRELVAKADEMFWYPSEVDVSIRPGWFYHKSQDDEVKSLAKLADIYFQSVGYNSCLLLNVPPDKRGLIYETDVKRLEEFNRYIENTFASDYAKGGSRPFNGDTGDSRIYRLSEGKTVNVILLKEDITKGQRIENFTVEALIGGKWTEIAGGTTVGYKRLLRCPDFNACKIRVTVTSSRGRFHIAQVGAYYALPLEENVEKTEVSDISLRIVSTENRKMLNDSPENLKVPDERQENLKESLENAVDGDMETIARIDCLPEIVLDCGRETPVCGFRYVPLSGENLDGTAYRYDISASKDGKVWTKIIADGEFSNIMHNPIPQYVRFDRPVDARFIKFGIIEEIGGKDIFSAAELGIVIKQE